MVRFCTAKLKKMEQIGEKFNDLLQNVFFYYTILKNRGRLRPRFCVECLKKLLDLGLVSLGSKIYIILTYSVQFSSRTGHQKKVRDVKFRNTVENGQ